jgi:hypothetical protein
MRDRRLIVWTGVLFAIGSTCFLIGPAPGFINLVGSHADGVTFFVGSIFFTSAAFLQYLEAASAGRPGRLRVFTFEPHRIDWWATVVQFAGTLFFNASTFHAMDEALDTESVNRLVWAPDALGSICFLISGVLAYAEVRGGGIRAVRHTRSGRIAFVNLLGCILFGISAIASYVVPETGDALDLAAANWTTALGALCFLIGALRLLGEHPEHDEQAV